MKKYKVTPDLSLKQQMDRPMPESSDYGENPSGPYFDAYKLYQDDLAAWQKEYDALPSYPIKKEYQHLVKVGKEYEEGDFKLKNDKCSCKIGDDCKGGTIGRWFTPCTITFAVPVSETEAKIESPARYSEESFLNDILLWAVVNRFQYDQSDHRWFNECIGELSGKRFTISELIDEFKRVNPRQSLPSNAETENKNMNTINTLLDLMALHGGEIVSTASLNTYNIDQARASGRMYVREDALGFVWMPKSDFPETVEEVERFEKWFPLKAELPESLKSPDFLFKIDAETVEKKGLDLKAMEDRLNEALENETAESFEAWRKEKYTPKNGYYCVTCKSRIYCEKYGCQSPAVSAPVEERKDVFYETIKVTPLRIAIEVCSQIFCLSILTNLGLRENKSWGEDENELYWKLMDLSIKQSARIIEQLKEYGINPELKLKDVAPQEERKHTDKDMIGFAEWASGSGWQFHGYAKKWMTKGRKLSATSSELLKEYDKYLNP
jgi:hypothetical protein